MASVDQTVDVPSSTAINANSQSGTTSAAPVTSNSLPLLSGPVTTQEQTSMREKAPTDSETALVAQQQPASTSSKTNSPERTSFDNLTRRLSGKTQSKAQVNQETAASTVTKQEKPTTSSNPVSPPTASSSRALPSSKPVSNTTSGPSRQAQKKRKKRKGLAGLFAALGCLSAESIDHDEPAQTRKDMAQKLTAAPVSTSSPAIAPANTTSPAAAVSTGRAETKDGSGTTGTAATTLTEDQPRPIDKSADTGAADVVVAPMEPAHVPVDETAGLTSAAVQPPGSGSELLSTPLRPQTGRRDSDSPASAQQGTPEGGTEGSKDKTETTSGGYTDISDSDVRTGDENIATTVDEGEYGMEEDYEDEEDRLIAQGGMGIPLDEHGRPAPLLPPLDKVHAGRKCLVLDLDETLLHSSFKMLPTADYIVPVEIESQTHNVYVIKRPGVDHFLTEMGKIYEVVIFTASLSKYADPVLDMLDPKGVVQHRLFRESCYNHKGNYVKDLSQLGRDMEGCIILDNSPASYIFHPNNAVPVSTWFNDPHDTELTDLCPFLVDLATVDDIRGVLDGSI